MPGRPRKAPLIRLILLAATLLAVFALDIVSKFYISGALFLGQSIPVVKNVFHISLVHNTGIAFGLFKNQTVFFIILSIIVVFFIISDFFRNLHQHTLLKSFALGLVLGGAGGNLLDRLRLGYVIDFLDFRVWPVFNIADSAITVGIVLLAYSVLRRK